MSEIFQAAVNKEWEEARDALRELEEIWGTGRYLIALNYAEPDYLLFIQNLAILKSAVEEQEATEAKANAAEMQVLLENFTKFVPLP